MYRHFFKRIFDFIIALILIILSLPFLLIGAIAIKCDDKGPVFFNQERVGKDNKVFTIYKLRSMKMQTHDPVTGRKLRDKERVTRAGRFVRKTSIDELPQLFNVLKGDMSFVGPRPLLVKYLPYYTNEELHRHDVRPGITGLAQVNGRSNLPWEERFAYDLEYVKDITFLGDLSIWWKTFQKVFRGSDTSVNERPKGFVSLNLQREGKTWNDQFTPSDISCKVKNVVISGATGALGREVINDLLDHNVNVVALQSAHSQVILPDSIHVIEYEDFFAIDVDEFNSFSHFNNEGFDTIHLAFPRSSTIEACMSGNEFTRRFINKVLQLGTDRIINASSQSVYTSTRANPAVESDEMTPANLYDLCKSYNEYWIEDKARSHKVPVCTLRIASLVGREYEARIIPRFIKCALAGDSVVINDADVMSFLDVKECANAIVRVLNHPLIGGIYNVGAEESFSLVEICECVNEQLVQKGLKPLHYEIEHKDEQGINRSLNVEKFTHTFGWTSQKTLKDFVADSINQVI